MKFKFLFACFALFVFTSKAQISTIPVFATENDSIEIIYDATEGNAALVGVATVFAHTGVITNKSSGLADWRHVQGNWGTNHEKVKMTNLGNDRHSIKYDIRSFYNVPSDETVTHLAFVFRNQSGATVGRAVDGSDIYVTLSSGGFSGAITSPSNTPIFVGSTASFQVTAQSSADASFSFFVNGTLINQQQNTNTASVTVNGSTFGPGKFMVKAVIESGANIIQDSIYYIVRGNVPSAQMPASIEYGINYITDTSVILALYAPFKDFVYVIGDFNDWEIEPEYEMSSSPDGSGYWLQINGLVPGEEYAFQYFIDTEGMRVADAYTEKVLDPWNDQWIPESTYPNLKPYPVGKTSQPVSILQTAAPQYQWQTTNYTRPDKHNLIVYELLVRDFVAPRTYKAVLDSLDYLVNMGINAIELMPIMEFEGNESWGYNPSFFFAPDKYYGPKDALKEFIDTCHSRGIAVILDIAINHAFGQHPYVRMWFDPSVGDFGQPAANNPYFNEIPKHDFNVGFDFNHESSFTRNMCKRILAHWVEEYKIDGYRFDLSKGFTQNNTLGNIGAWNQFDQSRIDILQDYANHIWSKDPNSYLILEHLSDNSEERELSNRGFMIWGIMHSAYKEAALGYNSNFNWANWKERGYNEPNLVAYAMSHDEERLMYECLNYGNSSGSYNVRDKITALQRMGAVAAFVMGIPGPKMFWQFDELGYDYSINFNGRTGNKPLVWNYLEEPNRAELYEVYRAVNTLKRDEAALSTNDYNLDVAGKGKRIQLNHPSMDVTIVGNFDVVPLNIVPGFQRTGKWYDYMTGDSIQVSNQADGMNFAPGTFKIYTSKKIERPDTLFNPGPIVVPGGIENKVEEVSLNAYPNPFAGSMQIEFDLNSIERGNIQIYDIKGSPVKTIYEGSLSSGKHIYYWNGQSDNGGIVSPGVYYLRLQTESLNQVRSISFLR